MKFPYRYSTRVRFHDADPAGITFFGRIFTYCHDAYEELMREGGVPLHDLGDLGLPLGHASADFVRPLPHGAELTVEIRVAELKAKTFTLEHTVLSGGEPCARLKTVHIAISKTSKRSVPLPERITQLLSPEAT